MNVERLMRICKGIMMIALLPIASHSWGATAWTIQVGQDSSGAPAFRFNPSGLNVSAGDTITFINSGTGTHNAHSADPAFSFRCAGNSDCVGAAATAGPWTAPTLTVPNTAAGRTIFYQCDPHGTAQGMTGVIVVNALTPVRLKGFDVD